jgi:hypothetical protein
MTTASRPQKQPRKTHNYKKHTTRKKQRRQEENVWQAGTTRTGTPPIELAPERTWDVYLQAGTIKL